MKRRTLTPEEKLWQQVWRTWPNAMEYEQLETPFDAPFRRTTRSLLRRTQHTSNRRSLA
jgi:hypothetical protein